MKTCCEFIPILRSAFALVGMSSNNFQGQGFVRPHFYEFAQQFGHMVTPLSSHKLTSSIGIDFVQEKILGQGPQDNESAFEQAKDEQISDFLRGQYKSTTGSDMPIKDKETKF